MWGFPDMMLSILHDIEYSYTGSFASGKEPTTNMGDLRDPDLISKLERYPGEGNGSPTPVFLPRKCRAHNWAHLLILVCLSLILVSILCLTNICCSVAQSCPTRCDPIECSMPGFPDLHNLPEFAQTHVHWLGDITQLFHFLFLHS